MPSSSATSTGVVEIHRMNPQGSLIASTSRQVDIQWLSQHVQAALSVINHPYERVGIALVDDNAMCRLHSDHCRINSPTDVLTFPLSTRYQPINVDIAACIDEAHRRATDFGHAIERELLLYIVHGLLHCIGFDDRDDASYAAMHAEEDRILSAIGVGATFTVAPTLSSEKGS